jgi:opacity protein-like surface antigen
MKKILLVSLLILIATSMAVSQFGIKGGINLATFRGDDSKGILNPSDLGIAGIAPIQMDPKSKLGFVAGISYKVDLILGLSLQPEVLYVQKGAIYEPPPLSLAAYHTGASMNIKQTMKLDYVEIPVLVKFTLPIPILSPYLEAGVSYGILVSAKIKTEASVNGWAGAPQPPSEETNIKDSMNKSDLSLQIGAGVTLFILEIDARFVMGLSKLDKNGTAKVYNKGIVLTAGLRF